MMRNLLGPIPRESLVLLCGNNAMYPLGQENALGPVEIVDMPNLLRKRQFWIGLPRYLEYLWVPLIAFRAVRVARREKVRAIFANYPFGYFLVAGWLASRVARLPLFVYMHSLWEETVDTAADRTMARLLEGRIFRDAVKVYVPTEEAARHYRAKHGFTPGLLPHAVNLEDGAPAAGAPGDRCDPSVRTIVFTGGVYNMNRDALEAMVRAVEGMPIGPGEPEIRFLVCAPNDPATLARLGIAGTRTQVRCVNTATAMRLQREADVLYVPLAFNTPWQDEIRTVFPTKVVEYVMSGTPILLHAPGDCYTVEDARRFGWAHVVATLEPAPLQEAIRRLLADRPLRERLVAGARAAAETRDARKIASELERDLGIT